MVCCELSRLPPSLAGEGWGGGELARILMHAPSLSLPRKRGRERCGQRPLTHSNDRMRDKDAPSPASTGSKHPLALRCRQLCSHVREEALGGHPQALQRYALAVLSHIGLIAAWYLFVKLGEVPKFVMPSPYETVHALLVPNYRWPENIAVTTVEIFGGYILAVVFGIGAALLFSWFR